MDANKGEAERCLREAEKWQRQNRPVKAIKFAKKSHSLFPTQAAQQKIGELTDVLQQRQSNYQSPPSPNNNNNNNPNHNAHSNPHNIPYQRRNAQPSPPNMNNNNNASNNNNNHSAANNNHNPRPQNQEFVEIDPNSLNNNNNNSSSFNFNNMLSFEFWSILLETVFGQFFGGIHGILSPILPSTLLNFNLRYRGKVWILLLITIILLITRYGIIGHPIGAPTEKVSTPRSYQYYEQPGNGNINDKKEYKKEYKTKSEYQRKKEEYDMKYNRNNRKKRRDKEKQRNSNNNKQYGHHDDGHGYYEDGGYNAGHTSRGRSGYNGGYGRGNGYYSGYSSYSNSNYGGGLFSGYNIMIMLIFGSMIFGMFRGNRNGQDNGDGNNNGGFNWNLLMLPMMFGGFPMGGMYGRFGGRRRRGWFGRRRYF